MLGLLIGLVIGLMMGLTGAGGALIAIPLLTHFFELSINQATYYSLLVVFLASAINLIGKIQKIDYKISLIFFVSGILGSFLSSPLKLITPSWMVFLLLIGIALLSLYLVLIGTSKAVMETNKPRYKLSFFIGTFFGVLTTLTGLGGGVLLVPFFSRVLALPNEKVIPTSLLSIALVSFSSFLIQSMSYKGEIDWNLILYLTIGIALAVYLIKSVQQKLKGHHIILISKVLFSGVVIFAVISFSKGIFYAN